MGAPHGSPMGGRDGPAFMVMTKPHGIMSTSTHIIVLSLVIIRFL